MPWSAWPPTAASWAAPSRRRASPSAGSERRRFGHCTPSSRSVPPSPAPTRRRKRVARWTPTSILRVMSTRAPRSGATWRACCSPGPWRKSSPDMEESIQISLTVNGVAVSRRVEPRQSLVDFLRYGLELTGSHVGCEHGVCGACTVRVDGALVRGCLMLTVQCDGSRVDTIEGVAAAGEVRDLQQAFALENSLQCGFCTPGMVLTAQDLLARQPNPSPEEIREALSGNYCRCTGYHAVVAAVRRAAEVRARA